MRRLLALAALPILAAVSPPGSDVVVAVEGLRSDAGVVRACLTSNPATFPDCRHDPAARRVSPPAAEAGRIVFPGVAPGDYAVSLLHDENGNGRADMVLMLPREGFGFSRNPRIGFGPPRFRSAAFPVEDATVTKSIQMRYLL